MPKCHHFPRLVTTLPARLRDDRAQALVEFAIVLPVLLLIVFGILYFGRYESYSNQLTQLAEVGARDAAIDFTIPAGASANGTACTGTNATIACYIASQATGELAAGSSDAGAVSVKVNCLGASGCVTTPAGSNTVTVCLQSRVQFPALNIPAGTVYQTATMTVETQGATPLTDSTFGTNLPSC